MLSAVTQRHLPLIHPLPSPPQATKAACEEMNARLAPYKADGKAWADVVKEAFDDSVNLTVYY